MNRKEPGTTEQDLVVAAAAGDHMAFEALVERYRDAVYGLAYHHLGSFEDARDVTQESFIKAYAKLAQLRNPSGFGPWVRQIAVNECRTYLRRGDSGNGENVSMDEPIESPSTGTDVDCLYVRMAVERALACLTDETRLAVTLFYINGYSHEDIAGFLDISSGAVKTRLRDARRQLCKELTGMLEDTLKSEPLPEEFAHEVVQEAIERAHAARRKWSGEDFVQSCTVALRKLEKAPSDMAAEHRVEVLELLAAAETYGSEKQMTASAITRKLWMPLESADTVRSVRGVYPSESNFDFHMWMPLVERDV